MKDLREMTVSEFSAVTWSDAPAPGGGSISALAGCLAASLAGMVANLSQGPKYDAVKEEMALIAKDMDALRQDLLLAVQQDTESFALYMDALSLPKNTEEEKAVRRTAMQNGLKKAAETPLQAAKSIAPIFPLIEKVIMLGNPNAVTDALVASMMARTGMLGALMNVKINLEGIRDEAYVQEMHAQVKALEEAALSGEKHILSLNALSAQIGN